MSEKNRGTIVIAGLGLMGASLAALLRKKFPKWHILGLSRRLETVEKAKRLGWIDDGATDPKKVFKDAALIIIATPVSQIFRLIEIADKEAPAGTIVTDLGSTKEVLSRCARQKKWKNIAYVGSHPLAGSHLSGLEHADPKLYEGAVCFVMQERNNPENPVRRGARPCAPTAANDFRIPVERDHPSEKAIQFLASFWKKAGCRVCFLSPQKHDALLAATSHLPHLLAYALVGATLRSGKKVFSCAGKGYQDMTRLAKSLPELWTDIFCSNQKNMLLELRRFSKEVKQLERFLEKKDTRSLQNYLRRAQKQRQQI